MALVSIAPQVDKAIEKAESNKESDEIIDVLKSLRKAVSERVG